jgi:thioredoxin 1
MKLLKFYADWCGPCKQQSKLLNDFPIEVQSINIEEEEELTEKYNVKNLPTLILLDDNNNELTRFYGLTQPDKIITYYEKM